MKKIFNFKCYKKSKKFVNNFEWIKRGEKCLLNDLYFKKGNSLKLKYKKICKYRIPIIIEEALGGTSYSFKVSGNIGDLENIIIYKADYRLIRRSRYEISEYFNNELNKNNIY